MKILLDECTPHIVKKRLTQRDIQTVQALGWAGIKNGRLLELAAAAIRCLHHDGQEPALPTELEQQALGIHRAAD